MPPATQNATPVGARGDVVEDELVRALVAIALRELQNIADDAMVAESNAFDDLAVAHVETGNDALGEHSACPPGTGLGLRDPPFEQGLAADRGGHSKRAQLLQVGEVTNATRRLPANVRVSA